MSKIKEVELKELREQEQKKADILHNIGLLETQKHSLSHHFAELIGEQEKTKKALEDSYGKINIDLQDGSYELVAEDV
jgi:uncharacterized membrane-anchored protein YhcB (DUF1043 family)